MSHSSTNGEFPAGELWDSLPRLERIAREYASHHNVGFDFTNAKLFGGYDYSNIAVIDFFHDVDQPYFEARIDSNGKIVETRIGKWKELPAPSPN